MASSSARRKQDRQCGRKVQYGNEALAWQKAYEARSRSGESIGAYRCPWCKWWHIGHKLTDKPAKGRRNWQLEFIQKWRTSGEVEMLDGLLALFREMMQKKSLAANTWKLKVGISMLRSRLRDAGEYKRQEDCTQGKRVAKARQTAGQAGDYADDKSKYYAPE